ncbi:acyltransferase family protein [Pluralibacter gergoviae]|uniref:acyltransferase family protein n=1 Tax=Pluralibacter gergoviae TaxID=61647 RepID=UPI002ED861F3
MMATPRSPDDDLRWISTLKSACILLVVLFHVTDPGFVNTLASLSAGRQIAGGWAAFNAHLSPLRMPAFFFVSGLLARRSIHARGWRELAGGRLANLLYLYLLWCLLQWLAVQFIIHQITGQRISPNTNAIYAASPRELVVLTLKGMSSAWYLYALFGYIILAKAGRKWPLLCLTFGLLLYLATALKLVPGWGPQSLCRYALFFLIGAFFSEPVITLSRWRARSLPVWLLLLGAAAGMRAAGISSNLAESFIAIPLAIAGCRLLNAYLPTAYLNRLGYITLPVYVMHRIFIELFAAATIQYAGRHGGFDSPAFSLFWAIGYPPLMTLLCAAAALGLWKLLNQGPGERLFALRPPAAVRA